MSLLRTETKQIGEHTYEATQLGAGQGRRVFARLVSLIGPALGELSSSKGQDGFGRALSRLAMQISPDEMDFFCDVFGTSSRVLFPGGKSKTVKEVFELHFAGKYDDMIKWLLFNLELNFGSFLGGLRDLLPKTAQPADAAEKAPSE